MTGGLDPSAAPVENPLPDERMSLANTISRHPRSNELAALVATLALSAADERRARIGEGLDEILRERGLAESDGRVADVDAVAALRGLASGEGRTSTHERSVLSALLGLGVAEDLQASGGEALSSRIDEWVARLGWLSAHTALDAWPVLDETLPADTRSALADAAFRRVRALDATVDANGRAEAVALLLALSHASGAHARQGLRVVASDLGDPTLRALASRSTASPDADAATGTDGSTMTLTGELVAAPFGPIANLIAAATGVLVIRAVWRGALRGLLRMRRPAEVRLEDSGLTVVSRIEVLGRTILEREQTIRLSELAAVAREVRYPSVGLFAGLLALAVGTFIGASWIGDGAWSRSPSLVALGSGVFALGVALDMALSRIGSESGGKSRLLLVPRRGRRIAVAVTEGGAADALLRAVGSRVD